MTEHDRTPPTLRSVSVVTGAKLVAMVALLGVVVIGVTQYQRHLFGESSAQVQESSGALGAVERSLIQSAGTMLEVLYRPRDGSGLDAALVLYDEASTATTEAFDDAASALEGTPAAVELAVARSTWDEIDGVVRSSVTEWTNESIYQAIEANADPWVATVWTPYDRLNGEMAEVRRLTLEELRQRSTHVGEIQRLLVAVVALALLVAVASLAAALRRVSRLVVSPLSRVEASARTLHSPAGYEPCDVEGSVAEIASLAAVVNDAAASLHSHQVELRTQASTDPMTGLPNREAFGRQLRERLDAGDASVGVLFVDLDDFKHVNDTLGHAAGDALLCDVAVRLRSIVGDDGLASRLGGDEFAVLVDTGGDRSVAVGLAERIRSGLSVPVEVGAHRVPVACSIGVVYASPEDRCDADALLTNADFAMYMAKSRGKGRHEVYSVGVHTEMTARLELARELSHALSLEQFVLHYQPVLGLTDGRLIGFEALLRWVHPERGLIAPDDFVPLAEETGAIVDIGRWVLQEACATLSRLAPHQPGLAVGVNVSPKQLDHGGFALQVDEALRSNGLVPEQLVLEITEATAMTSTAEVSSALAELRERGVHVALDDFGTGFSSLRYLADLPADIVKIDRSFVVGEADSTEVLLDSIVQLALRLGLKVVVEGIETEEDLERVVPLGDVGVQGYYFARPMPTERTLDFVLARAVERV